MGTLYIVATPIGNIRDITVRAIEVLSKVGGIACEDTRKTGQLLSLLSKQLGVSFENKPRLISFYEQNEFYRIPEIVTALKNGLTIALVSDAGTPTISDPGYKLVRQCIAEGITVEAIPGSSSVLAALVISGLPTDKFLFLGFLPHKQGNRKKLLETVAKTQEYLKSTIILFVAPHRLIKTLDELLEQFGDIEIVLCRELTKLHEEVRRELISQAKTHFTKTSPKGEFVLLFNIH